MAVRLIAALCLLALAPRAAAFHSGGVGECDGCHTMHGTSGGAQPGSYLLKASDSSSVCLHCHEHAGDIGPAGYHVSTADIDMPPGAPPRQLAPGGDFGWLKKTYSWLPEFGGPKTSAGERHGHNVIAADYGYLPDLRNVSAPGGSYPSSQLSCVSCHDPHGTYRRFADGTVARGGLPIFGSGSQADGVVPQAGVSAVGVYRLLGGQGYQPRSLSGSFAFPNPAPAAMAPASYNRSEASTQTRVAYGRGMSEWCANCHPGILVGGQTAGMTKLLHPAGATAHLSSTLIANYDMYIATGKLTGSPATAYLSLVPFEEGHDVYPLLQAHARSDDGWLFGPDANSVVTCLTCHRAHASGFDGIGRYRAFGGGFMTIADDLGNAIWPDPATDPVSAQGRSAAEIQQAYYDRPARTFAGYQRALCNKCHVMD